MRPSMNLARSLWAFAQGSPTLMRRVNGWLTILWIGMIPISYFMGWLSSVVYVSALSLWALVSGHWAAWEAARVEVVQEQQAEAERTYPLEDRVADRVLERLRREGVGGAASGSAQANGQRSLALREAGGDPQPITP